MLVYMCICTRICILRAYRIFFADMRALLRKYRAFCGNIGLFAQIYGSFAEIQGSVTEIEGSFVAHWCCAGGGQGSQLAFHMYIYTYMYM